MALTPKQQAFIDEYLIDFNARQAALRAGYQAISAKSYGLKLIQLPAVQAELNNRIAQRANRLQIEQDRVLLEIARIAFNDPRRLFSPEGTLLPVQDWPDEVAAAVASVKVQELKAADGSVVGSCTQIKFWDKGKQLELAARHLGMLRDKLELSTPVADLIRAARERIRID